MIKSNVTYERTHNGHPINADKEKHLGCHTEILDKAEAIFDHMTERHNKALYFRFDLHYPKGEAFHPDNKDITQFNGSYGTHLTREKLDPHYLWAREQSREKHQHYHCAYLVDGNKTASTRNHLAKAEELWNMAVGAPEGTTGLVDYCSKGRDGSNQGNSVMLSRNADGTVENYNKAFYRTSYLAKENTKGYVPSRVRQYGGTELPKRSNAGGGHEND